jgi:hypothetical protein
MKQRFCLKMRDANRARQALVGDPVAVTPRLK